MLNKTIDVVTKNKYILRLQLKEGKIDTATNTSPVHYVYSIVNPTTAINHWTQIWTKQSLYLNGSKIIDKNEQESIAIGGTVILAQGDIVVKHDDDGKKKMSYSFSASQTPSYGIGTASASGTVELTVIARASSISVSPATQFLGKNISISVQRASTSFVHKIRVKYGNTVITGGSKDGVTTSTAVTVPYDLLSKFANASSVISLTVECTTYSDSTYKTQIGSTASKTVTIKLDTSDANIKPSTSFSGELEAVNTDILNGTAYKLQNRVKVRANINGTAKGGATIKQYTLWIDGKYYNSIENVVTSDIVTTVGNRDVYVRTLDSRGVYSDWSEKKIFGYVAPFGKPSIVDFNAVRCKVDGTNADDGTYLKIYATITHYVAAQTEAANALTVHINCASIDADIDLTDSHVSQNTDNYICKTVISGLVLNAQMSITAKHSAVLAVSDSLGNSAPYAIEIIPTDKVVFNLGAGGKKAAFGKYAEKEGFLEIDFNVDIKGNELVDFVVEQGTSGRWTYRKWRSGLCECFCTLTTDEEISVDNHTIGNTVFWSSPRQLLLPEGMFCSIISIQHSCESSPNIRSTGISYFDNTKFSWYFSAGYVQYVAAGKKVTFDIKGKWK